MTERVFAPTIRLASPQQLRHCACGHAMTPTHNRHQTLIYRCDPRHCGRHFAQIFDVEAELVSAYRTLRARESQGLDDAGVRDKVYGHLKLAWVKDGHVIGDAVRFDYSL